MDKKLALNTTAPSPFAPKKCDDCTDSEKLERLRGEVRAYRDAYHRLWLEVSGLKAHQHGPNGLLVPIDHNQNVLSGQAGTWEVL